MYKAPALKIKNRRKFLRELAQSKKQNFEDNLKFVKLHAEWLKRKSNRDWSRQQKTIIDEVYRSNRRLHLKPTA